MSVNKGREGFEAGNSLKRPDSVADVLTRPPGAREKGSGDSSGNPL
jgi:hypothetical protein